MRFALLLPFFVWHVMARAEAPRVAFTENKGQWPAQVLYRANLPGGALFVERDALTYVMYSNLDLHRHAEPVDGHDHGPPRGHAYKVHFMGGEAAEHEGRQRQAHYENYFIGNDSAQWAPECGVFGEVFLQDVWPGIDLRLDGRHGLKYDLLVAPGTDPDLARLRFDGPEGLKLLDGALQVQLSTGLVVEEAPVVYQMAPNMDRLPVRCRYRLEKDVLSFHLQDPYDHGQLLVIDPVLTFASYSGSTADNFGFTATYDDDGHLYGGGIVFSAGYPVTLGAFDPTFNGGVEDIGISKWAPNGSTLIWSTYLGGAGSEAPHSMVVNDNDELYVMGSTGSSNFPTTADAFSAVFQGGPSVSFTIGYGFNFTSGVDLFVTHLNAAGSGLVGSTYVGGSGTDGVNTSVIAHNYGDAFRGEIALDPNNNPVVVTSTSSTNLFTTPGGPQTSFGGGALDAYVFRMNPALSTMPWSTYCGGTGADSGHGVQFDSAGRVYIAGGTNSNNLPMAGSYSGATDAYVARYTATGNALLSAAYLGTNQYDQAYFVQLDTNDDVFVLGQTHGNYPISPGVYGNPGSSQFIHKLSNDLATSVWSTRIGNGNIAQDLSPSAFLVSDCGQIYFSGWGGSTNDLASPMGSNTAGSPITPDAIQSTTNGSDFYLMVLEPDAAALAYSTYFGGSNTNDHVDGGTSRFDKNGTVYQAVCAGCGGQDSFPTTPGAYSNTNNSLNCNLGVFKFDLAQPVAIIDIDGPSTICYPATVQFQNNSQGGNGYFWTFGDGGTSTAYEPTHTYTQGGTFIVTLILSDLTGCADPDTASLEIISIPSPNATIAPVAPLCPGGSVQLQASDGDGHAWFPATDLSSTSIPDPVATPSGPMTYFVVITSSCGTDTASVDIVIADPQGTVMPDAQVCMGSAVELSASGGSNYDWSPPSTLSDPAMQNPLATPLTTTTYTVTITTVDGCQVVDSVTVNVIEGLPEPVLEDDAICSGGSVQLTAPDADSHLWQPAPGLSTLTSQNPVVSPVTPTLYVVQATNICGSILDSAFVDVVVVTPIAWPDTTVCPGRTVPLGANGGTLFSWSPTQGLDDPSSPTPLALITGPMVYTVNVSDALGCTGSATVTIGTLPPPTVMAWQDQVIDLGDRVLIQASGTGTHEWTPDLWLDCAICPTTYAQPEASMVYTVTLTDAQGCTGTAKVSIILNGTLFVPNTFTPNGDGINDVFGAWGTELEKFELYVFNRWGELIFESNTITRFWDGTYKGVDSPIDTYVWRVVATEFSGRRRDAIGHVNLVR